MKTLALALRTGSNPSLSPELKDRLQDITMDRRLKKAESIRAYLDSSDHLEKKVAFQMAHAEFGKITAIAFSDERGIHSRKGLKEKQSLDFLNEMLVGVERLVVFDSDHCLPFILKRSLLIENPITLREKLYSNFGTSTTALVDIKRLWAGPRSREYSGMTLSGLVDFIGLGYQIGSSIEDEANAILEIYEEMQGYLI